jgi:SAM domain (Sterile alpha motif)
MQQIADWLEKLGIPEYADCFAENKIDVSVLRHLTDQDLKDIGVPLGHRRKWPLGSLLDLPTQSLHRAGEERSLRTPPSPAKSR